MCESKVPRQCLSLDGLCTVTKSICKVYNVHMTLQGTNTIENYKFNRLTSVFEHIRTLIRKRLLQHLLTSILEPPLFVQDGEKWSQPAWRELVPSTIKEELEYKNLTIYMHVYFAILPFRNLSSTPNESASLESDANTFIQIERNGDKGSKNASKHEGVSGQVDRLDVIEEASGPHCEYDTDSLDQSQVVIDNNAEDNQSASPAIVGQEQDGGGRPRDADSKAQNNYYRRGSLVANRSAMEALKRFLNTEGETYSSQQEFLPYFALPYVTNPHGHPSFSSLFQDHWLHLIRERYYRFIHQFSFGRDVAPEIILICEEPLNQASEENLVLAGRESSDDNKRYNQIKRKFSKLQKKHQNLIEVAAELTSALEKSARGQSVDLAVTLTHCAQIYPELFAVSPIGTIPLQLQVTGPESSVTLDIRSELDVHKIKAVLTSGDVKSKIVLVQAIRWLITKSSSEDREQVVAWISRNDVLEVRRDAEAVVKGMLMTTDDATPRFLQQGLARLLNAVASIRTGRDYLTHSRALLSQLITCVKQDGNELDIKTAEMILATLQKLSLRRAARLVMVDGGLVHWVVARLQKKADSLYSLEYSTALLLNLCLHEEARQRCPDSIIKTLADLLDTEHKRVLPFVMASLYCLLSEDRLHRAARRFGLELRLATYIDRRASEPDTERQMHTLLRLLRGECSPDAVKTMSGESDEDDLDDPEVLEGELDADDPVECGDGQCGEALLRSQYRRVFPAQGIVCPDRPLVIMPSTPRSRPPTRGD